MYRAGSGFAGDTGCRGACAVRRIPGSLYSMLSLESHASRISSSSRLAAIRATGLLDDTTNDVLDRVARLARGLLGTPIANVSIVSSEAQYFVGMSGWAAWARSTPLAYSFCQHVVAAESAFIVNDARDHPLVCESLGYLKLNVVAYVGVPLTTQDGETLGAFCAIDDVPREWTFEQVAILQDLAAVAMAEIELRAALRALAKSQDELLVMQTRLRTQATRDELTGLHNRRGFSEHARQHLATAQRSGTPFFLLNLDLNDFKSINDRLGHDAGDQALIEMAAILKQVFRTADVIARMGGDEFIVLVSNSGTDEVHLVIARLFVALDHHNAQPHRDYHLATSIGIATFDPAAPVHLAQLLRKADVELYEHKRAGKLSAAAA